LEDTIEMNLTEIGNKVVDLIELSQDRAHGWTFMNMALNLVS